MDGSFILPAIILVPLIGAILTLFMGGEKQKYARIVAFVFTLITLGLTAIIMLGGDDLSQFDFSANWIDSAYKWALWVIAILLPAVLHGVYDLACDYEVGGVFVRGAIIFFSALLLITYLKRGSDLQERLSTLTR